VKKKGLGRRQILPIPVAQASIFPDCIADKIFDIKPTLHYRKCNVHIPIGNGLFPASENDQR
jgi:hypothetical protein